MCTRTGTCDVPAKDPQEDVQHPLVLFCANITPRLRAVPRRGGAARISENNGWWVFTVWCAGREFCGFFCVFWFFFFKSANELSQRAGSRETAFAGKHPRMPQIFARVRTGRRKLRFKPQLPAKMDCKDTKSVHLKFNERFAARTSHGTNTFCRPPSQLWPPNQSPARDACSWPVTQEGKASGPSTLGLRRRHRGTRKPGRAGRPPPTPPCASPTCGWPLPMPSTSPPPGGLQYLCPARDRPTGPAAPSVLHPRPDQGEIQVWPSEMEMMPLRSQIPGPRLTNCS